MTRPAAVLFGVLVAVAFPPAAFGHPTPLFLSRHTTLRVSSSYVLGHKVRVCSWRPGDARVRGLVRYSKRLATVPQWAGAAKKLSRAACALNGSTYQTAPGPNQYRPSGTVYAQGRRVRGVMDAPAVGFIGGRVIFGAAAARQAGSGNIVAQLAYLVRGGEAQVSHALSPWTTRAQFSCGARGTDGVYGCSRSCVVRFRGGRVGLVEVGHASMPLAAKILVRMGVETATTGDSGGAALMWTLPGAHNTGSRTQVGHLFGATVGSAWKRHLPDAIVVNARKLA